MYTSQGLTSSLLDPALDMIVLYRTLSSEVTFRHGEVPQMTLNGVTNSMPHLPVVVGGELERELKRLSHQVIPPGEFLHWVKSPHLENGKSFIIKVTQEGRNMVATGRRID